MRILTARMNEAVLQFVSSQQNGFVPGGFIAENIMLLKLVQAYVEEEHIEAFFLFLDMEKAFDRCSWDYLHGALEELGFGESLGRYVSLAYSADHPPTRKLHVNGYLGPSFPILSGVAQGCPASPLLFLAVTEAFTRLIVRDRDFQGVVINKIPHKISQFADDSTLILTPDDYGLARYYIRVWCDASAMRENATKREGLLLGALRNRPERAPPDVIAGDAWAPDGKSIRALGVPMGNALDETEWWKTRYRTVKGIIARWKSVVHLGLVGRNRLLQSFYYGSFRYWLFSLVLPKSINKLIKSDASHLLWHASPDLRSNEEGTEAGFKPFIATPANLLNRKRGGAGIMSWDDHVTAFYAHWGRRYLDPREAPWKSVLDVWVANGFAVGRGIIVTCMRPSEFAFHGIPVRAAYARRCISEFERLNIQQFANPVLSPLVASEPFWNSRLIAPPALEPQRAAEWRNHLQIERVFDTIHKTGRRFYTVEWRAWMYKLAPARFLNRPSLHEWVDARMSEVHAVQHTISSEVLRAATSRTEVTGESLEIVGIYSASRPNAIRWAQAELAEGVVRYHGLWLDTSRRPHRTGDLIDASGLEVVRAAVWVERKRAYEDYHSGSSNDPDEVVTILMVQGLETATYPGNVGWYLPGDQYDPACPKKLSDLTIHEICRHLTNARIGNARPSCEFNWEDRLDASIPWDLVWPSVGTTLTTPEE